LVPLPAFTSTSYLVASTLLPTTEQSERKLAESRKRKVAKVTGKLSERSVEKQQRQAAACFARWKLGK
jgi:hypothetical protein